MHLLVPCAQSKCHYQCASGSHSSKLSVATPIPSHSNFHITLILVLLLQLSQLFQYAAWISNSLLLSSLSWTGIPWRWASLLSPLALGILRSHPLLLVNCGHHLPQFIAFLPHLHQRDPLSLEEICLWKRPLFSLINIIKGVWTYYI